MTWTDPTTPTTIRTLDKLISLTQFSSVRHRRTGGGSMNNGNQFPLGEAEELVNYPRPSKDDVAIHSNSWLPPLFRS